MSYDSWWDIYRHWLMDQVNFRRRGRFKCLFLALHDVDFTYILDRDKNRAEDGLALRDRFCYEKDVSHTIFRGHNECSVLEMLVAFAIRIDAEWIGDPKEPRPEVIFETMLRNLNVFYEDPDIPERGVIDSRIYKWLDREFDRQGRGSIFPIKKRVRTDQRKLEIWEQMMSYISENYRF